MNSSVCAREDLSKQKPGCTLRLVLYPSQFSCASVLCAALIPSLYFRPDKEHKRQDPDSASGVPSSGSMGGFLLSSFRACKVALRSDWLYSYTELQEKVFFPSLVQLWRKDRVKTVPATRRSCVCACPSSPQTRWKMACNISLAFSVCWKHSESKELCCNFCGSCMGYKPSLNTIAARRPPVVFF